jgi:hypothetical protein
MRFPWKKSEPVDVAAIAREAASSAAQEVAAQFEARIERAATAAESAASAVPTEVNRAVTTALSPLMAPQASLSKSPYGVYAFDRPIIFSTPQPPDRRPGSYVTVETLRRLADNYDVLRACIQHLKREVRSVPIQIVPRDKKQTASLQSAIADAEQFFSRGGGLGGFGRKRSHFEGAILEDLLVVGASALFYHPKRNGLPFQVVDVDASTIRPRTDAYGWPGPGDVLYEQWIWGVLIGGYTADQMDYLGLAENMRSYSPYPASPVEWLVTSINAALNVDQWNLAFLTDGTTANDAYALPEEWTPDQIMVWQQHWNALLKGNTGDRQATKFVPGGTQKVSAASRKDYDFDAYSLWLLRRTCSIMGVQPASIGYSGEQYKVSQTDSMQSTSAFGAGVLLGWRKECYDDILERLGHGDLEVVDVNAREEKATDRATRNQILIQAGVKRPNEARLEEGLDPDPDGDVLLISNTLMPLSKLVAVTEEPAVVPESAESVEDVAGTGSAEGDDEPDAGEEG